MTRKAVHGWCNLDGSLGAALKYKALWLNSFMSTSPLTKDIVESPIRVQKSPAKLHYLDAIRGLAALAVTWHHASLAMSGNLNYYKVFGEHEFFKNGHLFVNIFFVLSGRVLALSYLKRRKNETLASAMVRRPFRLAIPVFICLVMMSLLSWSRIYEKLGYQEYTKDLVQPPSWWTSYTDMHEVFPLKVWMKKTLYLFSIDGYGYQVTYPAGVLWTIGLECFYSYYIYILAFIYVVLGGRKSALALLFMLMHGILMGKWYGLFVSGFVMTTLHQNGWLDWAKQTKNLKLRFVCAIMKLGLIYIAYQVQYDLEWKAYLDTLVQEYFWTDKLDYPLANGITGMIVILIADISPTLQWLLSIPFLLFMGRISFGIYMMHGFALPILKVMLVYYIRNGYQEWIAFPIIMLIYDIIACILAYLMIKCIDDPSIKFVNWAYQVCCTDKPVEPSPTRNRATKLLHLMYMRANRLYQCATERFKKSAPEYEPLNSV